MSVVHLKFKTQAALASTLLRFQEHYESPEFRDKIFTLGQFRAWYTEKYGAFSYCQDWNGFNIPSSILKPFYDGLFDPLTPEEMLILDLVRHKKGKFYVIGTHSENDQAATIDHELRHAAFYVDEDYRRFANNTVVLMPDENFKALEKMLTEMGYAKNVHIDEMQAYCGADHEWLKSEHGIEVDPETIKSLQDLIEEVKLEIVEVEIPR